MKSPRPKEKDRDEFDFEAEVVSGEEGSAREFRASSPVPPTKPKPVRRKSFFGSLFDDMDSSFVHAATEVALDFLYPMRKIDKRYNHR